MVTTHSGRKVTQAARDSRSPPDDYTRTGIYSPASGTKGADNTLAMQARYLNVDKGQGQHGRHSTDNIDHKTPPKPVASTVKQLIETYGDLPLTSGDQPLKTPSRPTPETLLALLLNFILSSTRISHTIASKTMMEVMKAGYHQIDILRASSWEVRTQVLTDGGYMRYRYVSIVILSAFYYSYQYTGRKPPLCYGSSLGA